MSSHEDSESQIVSSDDFCQPGVLGVAQTQTTQFGRNLKAESSKLPHTLTKKQNLIWTYFNHFKHSFFK